MAKINPAGNPNTQLPRTDTGRTYDQSKKIRDVGGAYDGNPNPKAPFVNPNPGGMLGPDFDKASGG